MLQVTQMCFMLDAMIPVYEDSDNETILGDLLECIFIQALYFSLGASLLHDGRLDFDDFVKRQCSLLVMEDSPDNKCTFRNIPSAEPSLFDYYLDLKEKIWVAWKWKVPDYVHDRNLKFSEILVPTVDTVRTSWLLQLMNEPSLFDYYLDLKEKIWVAWKWKVPDYVHDRNLKFSEILVPTVDTVRTSWLLELMNEESGKSHLVDPTRFEASLFLSSAGRSSMRMTP
ncbi:unnamed protein product [Timema podura]|uniref:Dynein heavy chain AAA 5 extension domain-containing protein n=1 Tax=Timema podura TaxID=61482 RepID=A0ABN7NMT9_TIMPD|nr:unnamed protein product [Timema podura]